MAGLRGIGAAPATGRVPSGLLIPDLDAIIPLIRYRGKFSDKMHDFIDEMQSVTDECQKKGPPADRKALVLLAHTGFYILFKDIDRAFDAKSAAVDAEVIETGISPVSGAVVVMVAFTLLVLFGDE